ncbi:MAG TPA: hypothetical protein VGM01_08290 [Ktedonobacteraceae bacterium]
MSGTSWASATQHNLHTQGSAIPSSPIHPSTRAARSAEPSDLLTKPLVMQPFVV